MITHKINDLPANLSQVVYSKSFSNVNTMTCETYDDVDVGDMIDDVYEVMKVTKKTGNTYSLECEHIGYQLINVVYKDSKANTDIDFYEITLDSFLNGTFTDLLPSGFSIVNNSGIAYTETFSLSGATLLAALTQVCEAFGVEFYINDSKQIIIEKRIGSIDNNIILFEGINCSKVQQKIDKSNLVTRIYPYGSSDGLPTTYLYSTLRPTKFYYASGEHGQFNADTSDKTIKLKVIGSENIDFNDDTDLMEDPLIYYSTDGTNYTVLDFYKSDYLDSSSISSGADCSTELTISDWDNFRIKIIGTSVECSLNLLVKDSSDDYSDRTSYLSKKTYTLIENSTAIINLHDIKPDSSEAQLYLDQNTDTYGVIERAESFDVAPELVKGTVHNLTFTDPDNDDLSGYTIRKY